MTKETREPGEQIDEQRRPTNHDQVGTDAGVAWHAERERLRRDRERTAWLLVEAEQRIASMLLTAPELPHEPPEIHLEIQALLQVIENLRKEIRDLRASTSWRATRPLRSVSGLLWNRKS
jgi:hypothetical protein